jgi:hypothetical protein
MTALDDAQRVILRARLHGTGSLVWTIEPGLTPLWLPNDGEFEGDWATPEAQAVYRAWQDGTPICERDGERWYVASVEITIGEA